MTPKYSASSIRAQLFLKRSYNDIDIVVEDIANRNVWKYFIDAHLPPGVKVGSVTLAGGRREVEAACANDQGQSGRPKLYLVDGDFDFLLGKKKRRLRNLYRLRAMNIENLLLQDASIIEIAMEASPTLSEQQIQARMDCSAIVSIVEPALSDLFTVYGASEELGSGQATCAYSVHRLCNQHARGIRLSRSAVGARKIGLLKILITQFGAVTVRQRIAAIKNRASALSSEQCISGKAYLLPIVFEAFKARFNYRGNSESFKVALARNLGNATDPYLKGRLTTICSTR